MAARFDNVTHVATGDRQPKIAQEPMRPRQNRDLAPPFGVNGYPQNG